MPKCVECKKRLPTVGVAPTWSTCLTCGKPVCADCLKIHAPICMAKTWGLVEEEPLTGKLIPKERPQSFTMG